MPSTQQQRQASVQTQLGADVVVLERFSASERLSELFTFAVDVIAPGGAVDFQPLLGTPVSIAMQELEVSGYTRSFSGLLFEAECVAESDEGVHYRLVLRPWFALLSGNLNIRIFQDKSVLDILSKVISDAGGDSSYQCDASGNYPLRTFCVQYRESDCAFLSRLMEEEGLYYYFEHAEDGRHILHVCDANNQHPYAEGLGQTPFIETAQGDQASVPPHLWQWDRTLRPGAGKVTLRDYDFQQPTSNFETCQSESAEGPAEQAEIYDYPGGYGVYRVAQMSSQKDRFAAMRLESSRAERERCSGQGDAFALACGTRFSLTQHPEDALNQEYLVIGATHTLSTESYRSGNQGGGFHLQVGVDVIPSSTQWRPPLRTLKPVAGGPQTATVVGPAGEVIYVDKYGRVKLQFHWDREGQSDDQSSCWIRVSQAWADSGFGTMLIPRIGEEVIVDFIDGDPDRPIITGRVYNPDRDVPYPLPDNKTRSTWKSRTVGQSGPYADTENPPPAENGTNEIRYEDKGGSEEVYLHAQRDMNAWIRHDETRKVGHDALFRVGHSRQTNVHVDETFVCETGDETHTVQKGSRNTTINQSDTLDVQQGDAKRTVDMGNYTLTVSEGSVTVKAEQQIVLQVGESKITMDQTSITLEALNITAKAEVNLTAQGLMSTLKADTLVTINGLPVQIN